MTRSTAHEEIHPLTPLARELGIPEYQLAQAMALCTLPFVSALIAIFFG